MRTAPAPRDGAMALATAVLAALLALAAMGTSVSAYAVAEAAGALAAGGAAVALALGATFGARLVAVLVAGKCAVVGLLALTIGPPGAGGGRVTVLGVVLVLWAAVVAVLALRGSRTTAAGRDLPPYAP